MKNYPAELVSNPSFQQYFNKLGKGNDDNLVEIITIKNRLTIVEGRTTALVSDINSLENSVAGLTEDIDDNTTAIYLLQSSYDSARTDLDTAIVDIATAKIDIDAIESRLDTAETNIGTNTAEIVELKNRAAVFELKDIQFETSITNIETILSNTQDNLTELPSGSSSSGSFPLSDSIQGTVPKVVGTMVLLTGEYAKPSAELGCPLNSSHSAYLKVAETDGTVLSTVTGTSGVGWNEADTGFTLAADTEIELLLSANVAAAFAIIKGIVISQV